MEERQIYMPDTEEQLRHLLTGMSGKHENVILTPHMAWFSKRSGTHPGHHGVQIKLSHGAPTNLVTATPLGTAPSMNVKSISYCHGICPVRSIETSSRSLRLGSARGGKTIAHSWVAL